ncbi:6,7-dimethyl-8-ribityllumazine synthase [Microbacterium lushaniae]|nr:6,7-dimethyl-8-ribityllumazine synthase [Microbacterium lushaniae]KAA9156908.1 6,7-dimethyl-8-ribityllumazine synthase [Microbacterium lushaniae]
MAPHSVALIRARWHHEIVDQAVAGFTRELGQLRPDTLIETFDVPGALELPLFARRLARTGRYAAVVAAAFVVDGGIYRHDFVAQAVIDGLMRAQFDTDVPVMSVSLTPHHYQPTAEHDAFFSAHFVAKGAEAARATDMILQRWDETASPTVRGSSPDRGASRVS